MHAKVGPLTRPSRRSEDVLAPVPAWCAEEEAVLVERVVDRQVSCWESETEGDAAVGHGAAGPFEKAGVAQLLSAEFFELRDRFRPPGKLEVVGGRPGEGLMRVDAVEGDRQVVGLLMVNLDLLTSKVKQDRAVGEPFVGAEVPDQPDVAQGSAGKTSKATTVGGTDRLQAMQPVRSVAGDAEVKHMIILPSRPAGCRLAPGESVVRRGT